MSQAISSDNGQAGVAKSFSLKKRSYAALQLLRPANSVTAMADVLAGIAIASFATPDVIGYRTILLVLAGAFLYGGGVALNDACDSELDCIERPERPIPSHRISLLSAFILAFSFLAAGVLLAFIYAPLAGIVACTTVLFIACYDCIAKRSAIAGPFMMGLCRSGSLMLGVAASSKALTEWWFLGVVPLAYIAAITLVGRGESNGKNPFGKMAVALVVAVILVLGGLAWHFSQLLAIPYLALFAACVLPAFWYALKHPGRTSIRAAVKAGVLSLVILDAALAALFNDWIYALGVLALFPVSRLLARLFPVA